jgi:hypothetical protein
MSDGSHIEIISNVKALHKRSFSSPSIFKQAFIHKKTVRKNNTIQIKNLTADWNKISNLNPVKSNLKDQPEVKLSQIKLEATYFQPEERRWDNFKIFREYRIKKENHTDQSIRHK